MANSIKNIPGVIPGITTKSGAERYLKSKGFKIVENPGGGDCLFHSLSGFGERTGHPRLSQSHKDLRKELIQYFRSIPDELANKGIYNENINELSALGAFNCNAGDIAPAYVNRIFGVVLDLYVFEHGKLQLFRYDEHPSDTHVFILRTGEHFRLLVPPHGNQNNHKSNSPNKTSKKKHVKNLANQFGKMNLSNGKNNGKNNYNHSKKITIKKGAHFYTVSKANMHLLDMKVDEIRDLYQLPKELKTKQELISYINSM